MKIKRICAWCNRDMGWANWEYFNERLPRITHGMCPKCHHEVLNDLNQSDNHKRNDKSQFTKERRL